MPLFGRKILVTGGTRGLGYAMALEFAARRAAVCITGRSSRRAEQRAEGLRDEVARRSRDLPTPEVIGLPCEVTDLDSVHETVEAAVERLGGLTDVVANAGVAARFGRFDHLDPEEWKDTVEVNLFGTYHTFLACLDPILAAGGGTLVGVSGYGAVRAVPFLSPYSASKAGVVQLVRSLAREFEDHPVRFLVLSPGILDHGLSRDVTCVEEDAHYYHDPYQRALRAYLRKPPEEAARLAASLVDPANPVPSGAKVSLHRPFEVTWAIARAKLRMLRGE